MLLPAIVVRPRPIENRIAAEAAALGDELDEVGVGDRQAVRLRELAVVELDHRRRHHDRHAVVAALVDRVAVVLVGIRARVAVDRLAVLVELRLAVGRRAARRADGSGRGAGGDWITSCVGESRRRRARDALRIVDRVPVLELRP